MNNATCQLFSGKFVNAPYLETVANYLRKVGTTELPQRYHISLVYLKFPISLFQLYTNKHFNFH